MKVTFTIKYDGYFFWLFKERKLLIDAQREVEDTHKKLYSLEAELSALKEERESLQLKLLLLVHGRVMLVPCEHMQAVH